MFLPKDDSVEAAETNVLFLSKVMPSEATTAASSFSLVDWGPKRSKLSHVVQQEFVLEPLPCDSLVRRHCSLSSLHTNRQESRPIDLMATLEACLVYLVLGVVVRETLSYRHLRSISDINALPNVDASKHSLKSQGSKCRDER